jgi:uncharacterized protein (TIGR03435 family)
MDERVSRSAVRDDRGAVDPACSLMMPRPSDSPGVHIAATTKGPGQGSDTGSDVHWALEGFDLTSALSRVFGGDRGPFPESRIELPLTFDPQARYDFVLVLRPHEQSQDRRHLMRQGIEAHFGVTIAHESRMREVYVLSVAADRHRAIRESVHVEGAGFVSSRVAFALPAESDEPPAPEAILAQFPASWRSAMASGAITGISLGHGTMEDFCDLLEQGLDRPVVDETGLTGQYDIDLPSRDPGTTDLAQRLHTELGFTLTKGQRNVVHLVMRLSSSSSV